MAIRTATVDRDVQGDRHGAALATYGTGGGIVWDSGSDAEYQECRAKALVLNPPPPEFALLETLLWRPRGGGSYTLLARHLDRLLASACYFGFPTRMAPKEHPPLRRAEITKALEKRAAAFEPVRHRVRLLAHRDARLEITAEPLNGADPAFAPDESQEGIVLALDDRPVDDTDPFLFHKTTARGLYEEALQRHPEADDVILWNARGELTESTRANLVLQFEDRWLTPPVACGLLAGTYRAELLALGMIQEQRLDLAALEQADEIFLINSVRGWVRARLLVTTAATTAVKEGRERRHPRDDRVIA